MTRKELEDIRKVLIRIKDPDAYVLKSIAIVDKNIEQYNERKGQIREMYEADYPRL